MRKSKYRRRKEDLGLVFVLKQPVEKYREKRKELYVTFIDLGRRMIRNLGLIFVLKQPVEKYREKRKELYVAFIDLLARRMIVEKNCGRYCINVELMGTNQEYE